MGPGRAGPCHRMGGRRGRSVGCHQRPRGGGDRLDLDPRALRQRGDGERRARRRRVAHEPGVDRVEGREVVDVGEEARRLDDVGEGAARRVEHRLEVAQHPLGLGLDAAPTSSPVAGSRPTWPAQNTRSSVAIAWLYGPTAAGRRVVLTARRVMSSAPPRLGWVVDASWPSRTARPLAGAVERPVAQARPDQRRPPRPRRPRKDRAPRGSVRSRTARSGAPRSRVSARRSATSPGRGRRRSRAARSLATARTPARRRGPRRARPGTGARAPARCSEVRRVPSPSSRRGRERGRTRRRPPCVETSSRGRHEQDAGGPAHGRAAA